MPSVFVNEVHIACSARATPSLMSPVKRKRDGSRVRAGAVVVSPAFREWARSQLVKLPRGTQSKVARLVGCSSGELADVLNGRTKLSARVSEIEANLIALGATPPIVSEDAATIRNLVDNATDEQREYLLAAADVLLNPHDSTHKQALIAMLRTFKRG